MSEVFQSKNTIVDSRIEAGGDVYVGDTRITNIFLSADYKKLRDDIQEAEQDFNEATTDEMRLRKSAKLNKLRETEKDFKQDILRLAETFSHISIDTERLRKVQEYIEQGNFREAGAVLKAEDLSNEQEQLLSAKQKALERLVDVDAKLRSNAEAFLLKAQLTATDYINLHRYELTKRYFENSINAFSYFSNFFEYARFLRDHHKYKEAEEYLQQALILTPDSNKHQVLILNVLGVVQSTENKLKEAEINFQKAFDICIKSLSNDSSFLPIFLRTLNCFANLQSKNNLLDDAEKKFQEALDICNELAIDNRSLFFNALAGLYNNLGILLIKKNELQKAESNLETALKIIQTVQLDKAIPPDEIAKTLHNLATLQRQMNKLEDAEKNHLKALSIRQKLAKDNPEAFLLDVTHSLNNLAILYEEIGKLDNAENYYQEALKIYKLLVSSGSQALWNDIATILNNLAILQKNTNKLEQSEKNHLEALKILQKLAEQNPQAFLPAVALSLYNLGILYRKANKPQESEKNHQKALEIRRKLAEQHRQAFLPSVADSLNSFAVLLKQMNRHDESQAMLREVHEICMELKERKNDMEQPLQERLQGKAVSPNDAIALIRKYGEGNEPEEHDRF